MKNNFILIVLIVIGIIVAGRAITTLQQPVNHNDEEFFIETESEDYEDLNSEILGLIAEIDDEGFNATQFDDILSIDPFELDCVTSLCCCAE